MLICKCGCQIDFHLENEFCQKCGEFYNQNKSDLSLFDFDNVEKDINELFSELKKTKYIVFKYEFYDSIEFRVSSFSISNAEYIIKENQIRIYFNKISKDIVNLKLKNNIISGISVMDELRNFISISHEDIMKFLKNPLEIIFDRLEFKILNEEEYHTLREALLLQTLDSKDYLSLYNQYF